MSHEEHAESVALALYEHLAAWDSSRARSVQSSQRILGMSDLGACREYIRATIAGDEKGPTKTLNWPAFVGTALGDLVERAMGERAGAESQRRVTVTLPTSGIQVSGSTDLIVLDDELIDLKTKDRLDDVVDSGPSYKHYVQLSGYFVGLVQEGRLPETAMASLAYLDRSGAQPVPVVFSIDLAQARSYLEDADERLADVAAALASGRSQGELRDEPESWCFYTQCPFYSACWGEEYQPSGTITAAEHVAAIEKYVRGKALADKGEALKRQAKTELGAYGVDDPVEGETETHTLKWTLYEGGRFINRRIDLRTKRRGPKRPLRGEA